MVVHEWSPSVGSSEISDSAEESEYSADIEVLALLNQVCVCITLISE